MRKEVKLGMFIGGGLVALLVVYLLVAPPSNNKKGAQLADGSGTNIADLTAPGDVAPIDNGAPKPDAGATGAPAAPTETHNTIADPARNDAAAPKADDGKAKSGDSWKVLDEGKTGSKPAAPKPEGNNAPTPAQPKTPELAQKPQDNRPNLGNSLGNGEQPKLYFNPNEAYGGGLSTDGPAIIRTAMTASRNGSTANAAEDAKLPAPVAGGTHVVRSGETFSSIAQTVYGSAAYWPALVRANPNVNPNNLKLGATITLPRVDEVKGAAGDRPAGTPSVNASVAQEAKIDTDRQYKVQSGDSLYKISLKLYGKSTLVDRLYEVNKQAIGPDAKKLKLGMILELPEKPAAPLASPVSAKTSALTSGPNFAEDQAK